MEKHKLPAILAVCALLASTILTTSSSQPTFAQNDARTFPETGRTVRGRFLEYWNQNGGLAQQGFPITEELQEQSDTDGIVYTMQYFERAVFEKHPEKARPFDVLLSLLGTFIYQQKYPGTAGASNQRANPDNARRFSETGKSIGGSFREYWERNGALAQQGYPISDEFQEVSQTDGKSYTVQYFERAVFEWHPLEQPSFRVLLSLLGTFRYDVKHGNGSATPTPPSVGNATATTRPATVTPNATATATPINTGGWQVIFENDRFQSLNLELIARDQYGQAAQIVSVCEDLFCWRARVNGVNKDLSIREWVRSKLGADWSLVAVGVHKNDWRVVKFRELENVVLPLILVASDQYNISKVREGLTQYRSVLANAQYWYYKQVDRTYRLLQPIIIVSTLTSAQWNDIAECTVEERAETKCSDLSKLDRFGLGKAVKRQYDLQRLPRPHSKLRIVAAPYTGQSPDVWNGAEASDNFAVVTPRATSVSCPLAGPLNGNCSDASYSVAHELGHNFGLIHPDGCDATPMSANCRKSIMGVAKPPSAILLQDEINKLRLSLFFTRY